MKKIHHLRPYLNNDMWHNKDYAGKITGRELIYSISILIVFTIFGLLSYFIIDSYHESNMSMYNRAIDLPTVEKFQYGFKTEVGDCFTNCDIEAIQPILNEYINGKYLCLEYIHESYNMHVVVHSDGKGHTWTSTYWSWDYAGSEHKNPKSLRLNGIELSFSKFNVSQYYNTIKLAKPSILNVKYIYKNPSKRYYIKAVDTNIKGVGFMTLTDGTISNKEPVEIMKDITIEEYRDSILTFYADKVVLAIFVLIGVCVAIWFCNQDNDWVNN